MPRRKISRVRNRSEVASKNPHGWIAFEEERGTRRIDERRERRKTHACLKVHSWYWNPAWKANRLLSSTLSSPSSTSANTPFYNLPLRQFVSSRIRPLSDLYLYVPRIIVYLLDGVALRRLSSKFPRRGDIVLTDIDIAHPSSSPISRNIWKTSMKIIERKTIHGDGMGRGVYSGEVGRGWTITNGYTSVAEIGIMLWKETASFLSCAFGDSFEWKKPQVAECI